AGRVTRVTDVLGRLTSRTYDSGGRLQTVSGPNQVPTTYGYDGRGLVFQAATPTLTVFYDYDARGNRTSVRAAGQLTPTTYTYDLANRLLSETNPMGQVTSFTYDAAGNRQ